MQPSNSTGPDVKNLKEAIYLRKILTVMAHSLNAELTAFSSWMIAGLGAMIGLLIVNLEKIARFIPPSVVGDAAIWFLAAVALHVVQRYLGAIIAGSVATGKGVESIPFEAGMDLRSILDGIENSTLWPTRYLIRWTNRRVLAGELAFSGRLNSWIAQIQAWLVFFQLIAVAFAVWAIAAALQNHAGV